MIQMQGDQAEIWSQGRKLGVLRHWRLRAENRDSFRLSGGIDTVPPQPRSIGPPLEVRIRFGPGVLIAPVQQVGAGQYQGMAAPIVYKGTV